MGNIFAKKKQDEFYRKEQELIDMIDADNIDGIKNLLTKPDYQDIAKGFSRYILNAKNIEIIRLFIPYININKTLRGAYIENRGQDVINLLLENGATPPIALGNPKMRCNIRRYDCQNEDDIKKLEDLYTKVKQQADDLAFPILTNVCEDKENKKTYYYISTSETKEDGTILCGAMRVTDLYLISKVHIDLITTQAPYNPNVKAQHVGSRLIKRVIKDAKKAGRSQVFLFSVPWAVPFYEKLGFVLENPKTPEITDMVYEIIKQKDL